MGCASWLSLRTGRSMLGSSKYHRDRLICASHCHWTSKLNVHLGWLVRCRNGPRDWPHFDPMKRGPADRRSYLDSIVISSPADRVDHLVLHAWGQAQTTHRLRIYDRINHNKHQGRILILCWGNLFQVQDASNERLIWAHLHPFLRRDASRTQVQSDL